MELNKAEALILEELKRQDEGPVLSTHEGHSRILQAQEDLWGTIKHGYYPRGNDHLKKKAARLGAVVVRFIMDCTQ